jgi:flagellar hook-length control protein FliK
MENTSVMNGLRDDASIKSQAMKRSRVKSSNIAAEKSNGFDALLTQTAPTPSAQKETASRLPAAARQTLSQDQADLDDLHSKNSDNPAATSLQTYPQQPVAETPVNTDAAQQADAMGGQAKAISIIPGASETVPQKVMGTGQLLQSNSFPAATTPSVATPGTTGDDLAAAPAGALSQSAQSAMAQVSSLGLDSAGLDIVRPNGANTVATSVASQSTPSPSSGQSDHATAGEDPENGATQPVAATNTSQSNVAMNEQITVTFQGAAKPAEAGDKPTQSNAPIGASQIGEVQPASHQTQLDSAALPAPDASKPQFTPHTIPMLAATMVRRFESGARQFTMRLDPPELGQVEVKLTVGPDKKVRAVVSADRPEALADLVRSARELTRALFDAGLELEERGLTFTMNDPSGSQQRGQNGRQDSTDFAHNISAQTGELNSNEASLVAHIKTSSNISNDPFQRWQRARIALTA